MKAYNAIYRTETIYADGYIVQYDDNSMEGIFSLDYMFIYECDSNFICHLKDLLFFTQSGIIFQQKKLHEFYASKQIIRPFETYFFFNNSGGELSLEIKEEITDPEDITLISMNISKVRN